MRRLTLVLWLLGAGYALIYLDGGWVPHDEGTLAHAAERVLMGELPHRDFQDPYTGGGTLLHAAGMKVFGVNLMAIRWVLYLSFLGWSAAFLWVAGRLLPPPWPLAAGALAVVWSIPVYPAGMPSWYNLFLATFGVAAFLLHAERGERRWLLLAGFCGGLSMLFKVVGVYFVAAGLLYLLFAAQERELPGISRARATGRALLVSAGLLVFLLALARLFSGMPSLRIVAYFAAAPVMVAGYLAWRAWRPGAALRLPPLVRDGVIFLFGAALPLLALILVYGRAGALADLVEGLFLLPVTRFEMASLEPPTLSALLWAVPVVVWVTQEWRLAPATRTRVAAALGLGLTLGLALGREAVVYHAAFSSFRSLIPLTLVAALALLVMRPGSEGRTRLFLIAAAVAVCGLVQFPASHAVYFFYVGPLVALLLLQVAAGWSPEARPGPGSAVVVSFFVLFAVFWVHPGWVYDMGRFYSPYPEARRLELPRGGLRIEAADAEEYEQVVLFLQSRSPSGATLALPDSPEVYFLSGLRNPTGVFFDFFDEPEGRVERVMEAVEREGVDAMALKTQGVEFSGRPPLELLAALEQRFPIALRVRRFVLRWRTTEPVPTPGELPR